MTDFPATKTHYEIRELCHNDVYKHLSVLRKSLSDLKCVSKKALLDNTLFWQKEIERVKQEKDQEWREIINSAEAENKRLNTIIESLVKPDGSKSMNPDNSEQQLWAAQNEMDQLSRQLDQKLIHINRLQIALAEQSKKMFELEKSCVLLCYQYKRLQHRKNFKSNKIEMDSDTNKSDLHLPN